MNEAAKTENDLRTEIGALKSQIEGYTSAAEPMSIVEANSVPVFNANESNSLGRKMEEANNLFAELIEELLMVMNGFEIKNKKGLHRHLERLKRGGKGELHAAQLDTHLKLIWQTAGSTIFYPSGTGS